MWFVEALLIFSVIYILIKNIGKKIKLKFPGTGKIISAAIFIGIGQFIIRIWLLVGTSYDFTNFQPPFFLQYIFLFALGIIAYQNNWMDAINSKLGKRWFIFAQVLIFMGFPALFIGGGAAENGTDKFMGGFTWQCFSYAIWEQVVGFSLIIGLFGIFKKRFNIQGFFAKKLSDSAYGVYIFHTPILLAISAIFLHWEISQLIKFIALAPLAFLACFSFAWLKKKIPGMKDIL